jgi:RHS repeat-associated protein
MSDRTVFSPATRGCGYPLQCPQRGRWLVHEVERASGVTAQPQTRETHFYRGARVDLAGRGWLGFTEHVVTNPDRGSKTTYVFNNQRRVGNFYPYAGQVETEKTEYTSFPGKRVRVETRRSLENLSPHSDRVLVRPVRECTERTEHRLVRSEETGQLLFDPPYSQICTTYADYDQYGFARTVTRTGGFETLKQETVYEHRDTANPRILGIVTELRQTSSVEATGQHNTRTVRTVPDSFGLPATETVEPDAQPGTAPLTLVTNYVRNDIGQVIQTTTTGDASAQHPNTGVVTPALQERKAFISYDENGYRSSITNSQGHREQFVYDPAFGVLLAQLDANGVLTRQVYDGFGRLVQTVSPVGADRFMNYFSTSESPLVVRTTHRTRDNRILLDPPTRKTRDNRILLDQVTVHHDLLGRPVHQETVATKSRVQHVWTRYDVLSRVVAVSAPQFNADETKARYGTREYDALDRLEKQTDPDGVVSVEISYDGLTNTITNARNRKTVLTRDPLGVVVTSQSQDQNGEVRGQVSFGYGPFGQLETTTKKLVGPELTTTIGYDLLGRRTNINDPDRGLTLYFPNAFGEVIYEKDPGDEVETRTYDLLGRLRSKTSPDGESRYEYDLAPGGIGALSSTKSPDGIETHLAYDEFGRPIGETLSIPTLGSFEIERWYDSAGRLGGIRYPKAVPDRRFEVQYKYSRSAGSVLWQVRDNAGNMLWQAEDHSAFGDVSQEVFGNQVRVLRDIDPEVGLLRSLKAGFITPPLAEETDTGEPPGLPDDVPRLQDVSYEYDPARNLQGRQDRSQGTLDETDTGEPTGFPDNAIRFQDLGTLMEVVDLSVDEVYEYDDLNRLATWEVTANGHRTSFSFQFDDDGYGNLTHRTPEGGGTPWEFEYSLPSKPHAITRSIVGDTETIYGYDARGRRNEDGDKTISYTWFDLPKQITQGEDEDIIASFEYDAVGARIRKISDGIETLTFRDLYERRSGGSPETITHLFRVNGPGRVVAEVEWDQIDNSIVGESRRYLHGDRMGSIELITGGSPGQFMGRQRFEPYGNSVDPANPAADVLEAVAGGTRLGFTGHEHDTELGLINMGGRIYDPKSAAFFSTDPIVPVPALAHTFHPYAYVLNNPANLVDPTGFQPALAEGAAESGGSCPADAAQSDTGSDEASTTDDFSSVSISELESEVQVDGFTLKASEIIPSSVMTSDDNGSRREISPGVKVAGPTKGGGKPEPQGSGASGCSPTAEEGTGTPSEDTAEGGTGTPSEDTKVVLGAATVGATGKKPTMLRLATSWVGRIVFRVAIAREQAGSRLTRLSKIEEMQITVAKGRQKLPTGATGGGAAQPGSKVPGGKIGGVIGIAGIVPDVLNIMDTYLRARESGRTYSEQEAEDRKYLPTIPFVPGIEIPNPDYVY